MGMGTVVLVFVNNARAEYLASREVQGYGRQGHILAGCAALATVGSAYSKYERVD